MIIPTFWGVLPWLLLRNSQLPPVTGIGDAVNAKGVRSVLLMEINRLIPLPEPCWAVSYPNPEAMMTVSKGVLATVTETLICRAFPEEGVTVITPVQVPAVWLMLPLICT